MNYIIIFSFLFNILLGIYALKSNYKNKINILFSLLAFFNSGIIITNYLVQIRGFPLLWGKLNIFFVLWIPPLFIWWCSQISKKKLVLRDIYWIFPSVIFSLSLLTDLLLKDFSLMELGYVEVFGPLFGIFYGYYVLSLLYGLILLLLSYKNTSSTIEKKKNIIAFVGALIPIATSIVTNTYFRIFGVKPEFMSNVIVLPITNSLMMLLFAYAVLKYGFLKPEISIKEKLDSLRIKILYITNIIIIGLGIIVTIIFISSNYPVDTTIIETFFVTVIVMILIDLGINYTLSKYIHEKIVAPIEKISRQAGEVGKGNFNLKVGFEGEDEIAILSRQMDEMTDKLKYTSQIRENFNKALQVEVNNKTQKLQDAYDALRESDKAKKDFIDAISHEIYNPLAIISVSNEFINLDKIDRENRKYISSIQRNVLRLISLVREIEEFNLIGKDSQKLNIQKFDLKELIESISQDFTLIANKRKIDVQVIPNGHDFYVEGDKENLTKVFSNLIENAVNFSNEGDRITIKIEEQDGTLKVEIKDRGIGIKHEDLENIFKKFYRAKVDDELKQGIGLGLPISLDIVNKHNGSIKVESEYGKGSKFTVILPRKHVIL
ncbi:MAG: HAMP domain-containing protein [Candidatus Methanofastidiosum sp.]|nr:HAMP domain-containing protein [Methanofastidiosum sp.]